MTAYARICRNSHLFDHQRRAKKKMYPNGSRSQTTVGTKFIATNNPTAIIPPTHLLSAQTLCFRVKITKRLGTNDSDEFDQHSGWHG
jgi:hypothetical protein